MNYKQRIDGYPVDNILLKIMVYCNKHIDIEKLDGYLLEAIKYLRANWYDPKVGIVACALIDGDKVVYATSERNGSNWLHAERNAYTKFKARYGEPSCSSVFVITLSPCTKDLKYRAEPSCADLIKSLAVSRIHFGVLDTYHVPSVSDYISMGYDATITKNESLTQVCLKLMNLFEMYGSRINHDLLGIKKEVGEDFLETKYYDSDRITNSGLTVSC